MLKDKHRPADSRLSGETLSLRACWLGASSWTPHWGSACRPLRFHVYKVKLCPLSRKLSPPPLPHVSGWRHRSPPSCTSKTSGCHLVSSAFEQLLHLPPASHQHQVLLILPPSMPTWMQPLLSNTGHVPLHRSSTGIIRIRAEACRLSFPAPGCCPGCSQRMLPTRQNRAGPVT